MNIHRHGGIGKSIILIQKTFLNDIVKIPQLALYLPSIVMMNLVYQTVEDCTGSDLSGQPKKIRTHASIYQQFTFLKYRQMGVLWRVLVFPSDTVISMRLPDSAFIFTAEIWQSLKL